MKDSDIINTYKKYQSSRMADSEDEIMRIVAIAHKKRSERTVDKMAQTAKSDEEHITKLFNSYQQQRDPHREEITATVMAAARQKIQQRKSPDSASIFQFGKSFFRSLQRIMAALRNRLTETKPAFHWQIATPALALIAVVTILVPQLTDRDASVQSYADHGVSSELLKQAPQLVTAIQYATPMAGFGFSDVIDPPSAAFQLGTMTTDLYLVHAANDSNAASATTINIQRVISRSGIGDVLLPSLENLNKAAANSEKALAIAHDLEQYFSGHKQEAMFKFGKWLEATLLATQAATDGASSQPLKALMMQWQQDGKNSTLDIPSPISRLVTDLENIIVTGEPAFDEVRKLRQQLLQIKAALQ